MLNDFIKKLPKGIELSPDIKLRAKGYIEIMHFGTRYYIPITKESKKAFQIIEKKGKLYFKTYKNRKYILNSLRDIIAGIYLQIRDSVGASLYQQLNQEIQQGFGKLFSNYLEKRIDMGLNQKLLKEKR